jgi:hypothetical protein
MTLPNRRWPRFTLRTLFVVVTILAILAAWIGDNVIDVSRRPDILRAMRAGSLTSSSNEGRGMTHGWTIAR